MDERYASYRNASWSKRSIPNQSTGIIVPPPASVDFVDFYETQQRKKTKEQQQTTTPQQQQQTWGRSFSLPMQTVNSASSIDDVFPTKSVRMRFISIDSGSRDRTRYPSASTFRVEFPYSLPSVIRIRLVGLEFPNISLSVDRENEFSYEIPGAATRTVGIERGNYDTRTLFSALQRAIARQDPYLRIEGSVDPVTQVSTVRFFTMVKLPENALRFATPLRVEFELPANQAIPTVGEHVLLSNIDSREVPDGIYPVDRVFSAISSVTSVQTTFVRLRVPFTSSVAPSSTVFFGGSYMYCGLPFAVKMDLSIGNSMFRILGFPNERTSQFLTPNEAISLPQYQELRYRMSVDAKYMRAADDSKLVVFLQAFDIPDWFRGQHAVLRIGSESQVMEILETEPQRSRVWLRNKASSALPIGDTVSILGPVQTGAATSSFKLNNIHDVIIRSAYIFMSADPQSLVAMSVNWISGVGTAYRLFVYATDTDSLTAGQFQIENWPLPTPPPSSTMNVLCWSPIFQRANSCGSMLIFRFGNAIFDNIARFGKVLFPIISEAPFQMALVSESELSESDPSEVASVAIVGAPQKMWKTDRYVYRVQVQVDPSVPSWVQVGGIVSIRASGLGSAFVTGTTSYEVLESIGFCEILEIASPIVFVGHSFAAASVPSPIPATVTLTVPKPRLKLSNSNDPIDLVTGSEVVSLVAANNGIVIGVRVPYPSSTNGILNNPFQNSASATLYGCPALSFKTQSVGSDFTSKSYDNNTGTLYMTKDTEALSWGQMTVTGAEQAAFAKADLLPTLTYASVTYYPQPMSYLFFEEGSSDILVCLFLLPPFLPFVTSNAAVTVRSNTILRGRTETETFRLDSFTRIAYVETIPRRTAQAVWLTTSPTLSFLAGSLPMMDLPAIKHIRDPDATEAVALVPSVFAEETTLELTIPSSGPFCNFAQRLFVDSFDDVSGFVTFHAENFPSTDDANEQSVRFSSQPGTSFRPPKMRLQNNMIPNMHVQLVSAKETSTMLQLSTLLPSTVSTDPVEIAIVDFLKRVANTGGGFQHPDTRTARFENTRMTAQLTEDADIEIVQDLTMFVPNLIEVDIPGHGLNQLRCIKNHPTISGRLIVHTLLPPDLSPGATVNILLKYEKWNEATDVMEQFRDDVSCTVESVNRNRKWAVLKPVDTYSLEFPLHYGLIGLNADRIDFYNISNQFDASLFKHPNVELVAIVDENRVRVSTGDVPSFKASDITNEGGSGVRVSHPSSGFKSEHTNVGVDGEIIARPQMDMSEFHYLYLTLRVPGHIGNQQIGMFSTSLPREEFILAKIVLTQPRAILFNNFISQDMSFLPNLANVSEIELRLIWPDGTEVDITDEYSVVLEMDELVNILSSESVIPTNPPKND